MVDFSINEMQAMQKALQDKYKHKSEPICPEIGQNKLLWMIGEIGEVIDIVKKHGGINVSANEELRKDLIEEIKQHNDIKLEVVATANLNVWNGRTTPQLAIKAYEVKNGRLEF